MPDCIIENGRKLAYEVKGEGDPIVFVHGVGAYKESWDGVVAYLSEHYRCYYIDLRGHGASDPVPGPYSLEQLTNDLWQFLDGVGLDRVILVGFSLGGLIAQQMALSNAARLKKLILVSTVADRTKAEKERVRNRASNLQKAGAGDHLTKSVERWFSKAFIAAHPEVIEERQRRVLMNDPASYKAAYEVLANSDLGAHLHQITVPTLVMTGENDIGSTPRMAAVIKERVPDSRLRILPGLRHSVLLEAPSLVAQEILAFLQDS